MKRHARAMAAAALVLAAASPALVHAQGAADPAANFVLFVSNQSPAIPVIDVEVRIDGDVVVSEDLDVGTQHTWKRFPLALTKGKHKIAVASKKGKAKLKKKFEIAGGVVFAVLEFWYYPKTHYMPTKRHFTFRTQDQQPIFM